MKLKPRKKKQKMLNYVDITMLSKFDSSFLRKNYYFSTIDEKGRNRDEDEDLVGRKNKSTDIFEQVMTAITHESIRNLKSMGVRFVIPTYQINKFLGVKESDAKSAELAVVSAIIKFLNGDSIKVGIDEEDIPAW